jgi:2-polyprenyl-3-methyl-5-hydroxy-6-metoxy-1,4-benzoquinol methylase
MKRLLDAGCGANHHPEMSAALREASLDTAHITGLDIDADALEAHPYLDERIVGSIETYPLPREEFDGVICWDVLEHLHEPSRALENLAQALKPGGLIILGFPNVLSMKGLITKLTPHWFHCWVYRRVYKSSVEPYPTVMRWSLRPGTVCRWAEKKGFDVTLQLLRWRSESRVYLRKPVSGLRLLTLANQQQEVESEAEEEAKR